jgi:lycopene beta-cyclase
MDATVEQTDGFHFVYTLPLTPTRVLVEDTYFSDTPDLDRETTRTQVERYLGERVGGWRVIREESGVLPMPWRPEPRRNGPGPLVGGYAGGWFHPATGYSFPVALRFALAVASVPPEDAARAANTLARRLRPRWQFARFLNRLLFQFVPPDGRWQVFARLYRTLPPAVLARFYALEFTAADAGRILVGRPPRIDLLRPLRRPRSTSWLSLSPR